MRTKSIQSPAFRSALRRSKTLYPEAWAKIQKIERLIAKIRRRCREIEGAQVAPNKRPHLGN